jgi:hypothetical protein
MLDNPYLVILFRCYSNPVTPNSHSISRVVSSKH